MIKDLIKKDTSQAALDYLYNQVISMNRQLGLLDEDVRYKMYETYQKLTDAEYKEMLVAYEEENREEFVKELVDTLVTGCFLNYLICSEPTISERELNGGYALFSLQERYSHVMAESLFRSLDIDHMEAVEQVVKSNWSKFPTMEDLNTFYNEEVEELKNTIQAQKDTLEVGDRYKEVTHTEIKDSDGTSRYVFWAAKEYGEVINKKYLKGCSYVEADMSGVFK